MLWLEIQEGKERMRKQEYSQLLGGTAACVLRGVIEVSKFKHHNIKGHDNRYHDIKRPDSDLDDEEGENPSEKNSPFLFFGDSWFGSVKAAANVGQTGNHACFNVKTGHSRFPKAFLQNAMKDFPGGTWITMEGKAEKEGVDLIAIGYKYNSKKVLTFVTTRGAGSTKDGEPYIAQFPDKYGNVCQRHVACPKILSHYFQHSNCVDLHNQARQFDLALEKKWVTQNAYFRLYTTMIGMTVVDAWKHHRIGMGKPPTIKEYANVMAADMIGDGKDCDDGSNNIVH